MRYLFFVAIDELERKKSENKDIKKRNTALSKTNERLEARVAKCESVLQDHGLLSEVGKRRKTPTSSISTEISYQDALSSGTNYIHVILHFYITFVLAISAANPGRQQR